MPERKQKYPVSLILLLLGLVAVGTGIMVRPASAQQSTPTVPPLPLYALPDPRGRFASSSTIALSRDNQTLVSANMLNDTISIILPRQRQLVAEIPVGKDPRSIAVTDDGTLAVVTNRQDGTLMLVEIASQQIAATIPLGGIYPYGVVIGDNNRAYVSLQGSHELVTVDLTARQVITRIPTPALPTGLALWGDFLYVTHFWSGEVSLVYLPLARVIDTISTGSDTGLSPAIELDVTRGIAYLPQTRSNAQNQNLTFDTTVFPVVNLLDLRTLTLQQQSRINLDTMDRPVNMPFALALDRFRNSLYIANAGSNNVTVIDLGKGIPRGTIPVDSNPRGLLLNPDNTQLYIHNALEGTLTVVQTSNLEIIDELPISNFTVPVDILLGAQFFYTAASPKMSAGNWVSCGNCHFDGLSDGRVWQGFADGPRNTPVLFGLSETAPYNWSGTWDELHDVEFKIRSLQAGTGLAPRESVNPPLDASNAGISLDLDILAGYLASLTGPRALPAPNPDLVARGAAVFQEQGCAECHTENATSDGQVLDVGTGDNPLEQHGAEFNVPTLHWLWMSAPYLHDGRAATLLDVFILPGNHQLVFDVPMDDIQALAAYLLTLPAP